MNDFTKTLNQKEYIIHYYKKSNFVQNILFPHLFLFYPFLLGSGRLVCSR